MTTTLHLAANISSLRKEAGLTQQPLAEHMGVSKASVSKWETGQSLPDLTLIPQLAIFFGVTTDKLLGYDPQLSEEDISAINDHLRDLFTAGEFQIALEEARRTCKQHYSCYPLLLQTAALFSSHAEFAPSEELRNELTHTARTLCRRVRSKCQVTKLVRQASIIEASLEIQANRPHAVVDLLEGEWGLGMTEGMLLAAAKQILKDNESAEEILQADLCNAVITASTIMAQLSGLHTDDAPYLGTLLNRFQELTRIFNLNRVFPSNVFGLLNFAGAYLQANDEERALECLEEYTRLCKEAPETMTICCDEFFTHLEPWIQSAYSGEGAMASTPLIRAGLYESLAGEPFKTALAGNPRYEALCSSLEDLAKEPATQDRA